jgi:transcriptional regulator with XRE-family HTH domain
MASAANAYPLGAETLPRSLFGKPTRRAYRAAVKQIVLDVQARKGMSDLELADLIGCHKETIENARNEETSLDVLTLLNIAYAFGEEAIWPVRNLYLFAAVEELTPLERIARANREIMAATAEMEGVG